MGRSGYMRVCIAPTVWQCLIGEVTHARGIFHIYEINVERPPSRRETLPTHETDEKWLTDDDINECGGKIEMTYRGFVQAQRRA